MMEWIRPSVAEINAAIMDAERRRDYESAALASLALADLFGGEGEAASAERQAQVYATLHHAQTALFIAEHRQPGVPWINR